MAETGHDRKDEEPAPLRELARVVGVSYDAARGWVAAGLLPAKRAGGRLLVRADDLTAARDEAHADGAAPAWRADPHRAGARLRTLREAKGMSQIRLAATSGVTHELVSRLERGRGSPRAGTVRALAEALRVEPCWFVATDPIGLRLLSVAEVAAVLGVPAARAQKWLRRGELPGTKVSGQWRVPAVAVAELARSGRLRGRSQRLDPRFRGGLESDRV